MLALSIRQPFAELILRGIKRIEYRTRPTRIIGERFYIYASKGGKWNDGRDYPISGFPKMNDEVRRGIKADGSTVLTVDNIAVPACDEQGRIDWMIELAEQIKLLPQGIELPRGVIVGSAVIERCVEVGGRESGVGDRGSAGQDDDNRRPTTHNLQPTMFRWHLADVRRIKSPRKPKGHPQPVWFKPF